MKQAQTLQQGQIVAQRLAKTNAGVDGDVGAGNAGRFRLRDPCGQSVVDIQQHIVIARIVLHRGRAGRRVHQDHRHVLFGNHCGHKGVKLQGRHVIDPGCARLQSRPRHGGLAGIDRDCRVQAARTQSGNHRRGTGDFFVHRHLNRTGPGAFAANVDDLRARGHQPRLHHCGFRS